MIEFLKIISLIFGVFLSAYTITKIFSPFLKIKRLKRFFELVQGWFDEIDKNLESGINLSILNNNENTITRFLEDNRLNKYKIKISQRFIKKYLKKIGIKKESRNDITLFYKYSRCDSREIYLQDFWYSLYGTFSKFYSAYKSGGTECNFADIEMKIKFLRQYLKIKEK